MPQITDLHTHTTFSADGKDSLLSMYQAAREKGVAFWGISDHFDYDYKVNHILFHGKEIDYIREEAYFTATKALQREAEGVQVLVGCECGFCKNPAASHLYGEVMEKYTPDYAINSVHTNGKFDFYERSLYEGRTQKDVYNEYLDLVRESLEAPYRYDIVAHLGYCTRFSPYPNRAMRYEDYADRLDDILKNIIAKDKILEVNSSVRGQDTEFLPYRAIIERYFALGGRKVSFGSDAHFTARLCEKRERVATMLKEIGFTHVTVPTKQGHIFVLL